MKWKALMFAALAAAPVTAAMASMPVATFLAKSEALKSKGPMAFFSRDYKVLMGQVKTDAAELRAENKAAEAAGRAKAYCTPASGVKLGARDIMAAMQAVPPAQRQAMTTKAALRAYFARRYPCRA